MIPGLAAVALTTVQGVGIDLVATTTGFAAILDVLDCQPKNIYLTGFDFFTSGLHNVDERWRPGDPADPIGHRPQAEAHWVQAHADQFLFDRRLRQLLAPKK